MSENKENKLLSGLGSVIEKVVEVKDQLENKVSDIKENLMEYIPEVDFGYIESQLENIGYKVTKIEIAVTIPPRASIEIDLDNSIINELEKRKIEDSINVGNKSESETNIVLVKILQGLNMVAKMQEKINFSHKKLSRVQVEGSLIPTIKMIYLDEDVIAEKYLRDKNLPEK